MYSQKFSERSPLRVLEKSINGRHGRGNIGAVVSRAGVGKTACLVQIGIDALIRDRKVLHVSLHDSVDHTRTWYDEMLDEFARAIGEREFDRAARSELERARHIHTYREHSFSVEKLANAMTFLADHAAFTADVVIIDGFDFRAATLEQVGALRELAVTSDAEVWMSALSHREEPIEDPRGIPSPVARFAEHVAVVMYLEPRDTTVLVRILKDSDNPDVSEMTLQLDRKSFLIRVD